MRQDFSLNKNKKGTSNLEHKERYYIIISEEWYMLVLQLVRKDFLPCQKG